jgi:hypothetical protein
MARWQDVEDSAPEFAAAVRELLDGRVNKTLATLRADGSPRISGTEAKILDGDVWFGSMPAAVKARDLQRDPRFALHGGSIDPPEWKADAKLSGRAVEVADLGTKRRVFGTWNEESIPTESHLFRADIHEVSIVSMGDPPDHLVIEHWAPDRGFRRWTHK